MTSALFSYFRIFCITENQFRYIFSTTPPTACPVNPAHMVNLASVSEIGEKKSKLITFTNSPYHVAGFFLRADSTAGEIEVKFPKASTAKKARVYIQRVAGSNNLELIPFSGDTIDGLNPKFLTTNQIYKAVSDGGIQWTQAELDADDGATLLDPYLPSIDRKGHLMTSDGGDRTYLPIGAEGHVLSVDTSSTTHLQWKSPFVNEYYHLRDSKTTLVPGGTSTMVFSTRDLNTLLKQPSTSTNISLLANQFTLQPGVYFLSASAPAFNTSDHQIRLFNFTTSSVVVYGTSERSTLSTQTRSFLSTIVSPSTATTYRIEHRAQILVLLEGWGTSTGFAGNSEVYTIVDIVKIG